MRGQIATDAGHTIRTMLLCNTVLAMCQWAWSWWVMWLVSDSDSPGAYVLPRRRQKIKWKSARLSGWVWWRHNSSQSERASLANSQPEATGLIFTLCLLLSSVINYEAYSLFSFSQLKIIFRQQIYQDRWKHSHRKQQKFLLNEQLTSMQLRVFSTFFS